CVPLSCIRNLGSNIDHIPFGCYQCRQCLLNEGKNMNHIFLITFQKISHATLPQANAVIDPRIVDQPIDLSIGVPYMTHQFFSSGLIAKFDLEKFHRSRKVSQFLHLLISVLLLSPRYDDPGTFIDQNLSDSTSYSLGPTGHNKHLISEI